MTNALHIPPDSTRLRTRLRSLHSTRLHVLTQAATYASQVAAAVTPWP